MDSGFCLDDMRAAALARSVEWLHHGLERMIERDIRREDVLYVLIHGERIEDYPRDRPFPSALLYARINGRPLHVVASFDSGKNVVFIITAYEPGPDHFENDFKTRREIR